MPPPTFRFATLGTPRVSTAEGFDTGLPAGKPLALLALIALETSGVRRSDAVAILWPAAAPDRGRASVRQALWTLRKALGDDVLLEGDNGFLRVDPARLQTDLAELDEAIRAAATEEVLGLWSGGPFHGFAIPDAPAWNRWASEIHGHWEARLGAFLQARLEALPSTQRLPLLERALAIQPYRASLHRQRIQTLLDTGALEEAQEALGDARAKVGPTDAIDFEGIADAIRDALRARYDAGSTDSLPLSFVGRSTEFAAVSDLWHRARTGEAQSVAIVGPPGIGKTRLAAEFLTVAGAGGGRTVSVQGEVGERGLEFGVAGNLARKLLSLPGSAGISNASAEALRALVPSSGNGVDHKGAQPSAAALADALTDLLDAVGHEAPLVVLVDDLQWVDEPSRVLIQRASRLTSHQSILLVQTCRTEGGDSTALRALKRQAQSGRVRTVSLGPLDSNDVCDLLTQLAAFPSEEAAEEVAVALHRASRGVPLYLTSLLRSLRDEGVLEQIGEAWTFHVDRLPSRVAMPGELHGLLADRVENLSHHALRVAEVLAHGDAQQAPADLRLASGLSSSEFSAALSELFASDLVHWADDERVELSHDLIRAAILDGTDSVTRLPWPLLGSAAAAVLVLLAAVAWITGTSPEHAGALYAQVGGNTVVRLRPAPSFDGPWTLDTLPWLTPDNFRAQEFFREPDGRLGVAGAIAEVSRSPSAALVVEGGEADIIAAADGDRGLMTVSPDGKQLLIQAQLSSPGAEVWREHGFLADRGGVPTGVELPSSQGAFQARWDPRGLGLVARYNAAPDSIVLYMGDGTPVWSWKTEASPNIGYVGWCPDGQTIVAPLNERGLLLVDARDPESIRAERIPLPVHLSHAVCVSGSPLRVFLVGAQPPDPAARPFLWEGEELSALDDPWLAGFPYGLSWVSDEPLNPVVDLTVPDDTIRLRWGESASTSASVVRLRGDTVPSRITWISSNPASVSVRESGAITGVRPGESWIVGAFSHLRDSALVVVSGSPTEALLFQEDFRPGWEDRWDLSAADPQPAGILDGDTGGWLLDLRGDGSFGDPLATTKRFDASRGFTLEAEYRVRLNRRNHQRVFICLISGLENFQGPTRPADTDYICHDHPHGELAEFAPDAGNLVLRPGATVPFPMSGDGAWHHVAIQMTADGRVALFLDGDLVAEHPFHVQDPGSREWRVMIGGSARDGVDGLGRTQIRDVRLWAGPRYESIRID